MRVYKKITLVAGMVTLATFAGCIILHYGFTENREISFWLNIVLAVFGSALLTAITSWITYFYEKRQTIESFVYSTRRILKAINHYQKSMSLDEKIEFFLSYSDEPKDDWDMQIGNMDFFFEIFHHNRRYIYNKIYMPILTFNQAVGKHVWHFRWHLDGSGKNDTVMESFVKELEDMLITESSVKVPAEWADDRTPIRYTQITTTRPKLVDEVQKELNGKYFDCMYGKKAKYREEYSK